MDLTQNWTNESRKILFAFSWERFEEWEKMEQKGVQEGSKAGQWGWIWLLPAFCAQGSYQLACVLCRCYKPGTSQCAQSVQNKMEKRGAFGDSGKDLAKYKMEYIQDCLEIETQKYTLM